MRIKIAIAMIAAPAARPTGATIGGQQAPKPIPYMTLPPPEIFN